MLRFNQMAGKSIKDEKLKITQKWNEFVSHRKTGTKEIMTRRMTRSFLIWIRLPLILSEGIGDSLYLLSLLPHKKWSRLGIGFNVFYQPGSSHTANYGRILRELIEGIPYLNYIERTPTSREKKIDNRLKRHFSLSSYWREDRFNKTVFHRFLDLFKNALRVRPFYPVHFLSSASGVELDSHQIHIAFQTHQDGATFKQWGVDRWCEVFDALVSEYGNQIQIWIVEYNRDARNYFQTRFPKIQFLNELHQEFPVICQMLQKMDLVVGVDSWFKFVTSWSSTNTLVIVPSHEGVGYWGDPTADRLSRSVYDGLLNHPCFEIVGIDEISPGHFKYSLPSLSLLEGRDIFQRIIRILDRKKGKTK